MSRYESVPFDKVIMESHQSLQAKIEDLTSEIENNVGGGRYKSLAITALEESFSWLGKALREDQKTRNMQKEWRGEGG